jgi:imidazole glycerol-phosphate synthase subunit HisH
MSQRSVTIIDYGMCNMLNVARAFEHCGAHVIVTEDPKECKEARRLVVPGVGAFSDSVKEVSARGFGDAIREFAQTRRPILGICVGMQMLFDTSEEFGEHSGLGILPGRVMAIPSLDIEKNPQRIPHIGWNHLLVPEDGRDWRGTLLDPMTGGHPAFYFLHSFAVVPKQSSDRLADCLYSATI